MSSLKRGIYYLFPDNKMIQIDDTLVSLDLIEANFICDLAQCKAFAVWKVIPVPRLRKARLPNWRKRFRSYGTTCHPKPRQLSTNKA